MQKDTIKGSNDPEEGSSVRGYIHDVIVRMFQSKSKTRINYHPTCIESLDNHRTMPIRRSADAGGICSMQYLKNQTKWVYCVMIGIGCDRSTDQEGI